MYQHHYRRDLKGSKQRPDDHNRVKTQIHQADFNSAAEEEAGSALEPSGWQAYAGNSKIILDLLRDPVSLGIAGSNSNRGHQR